MKIKEKMHNLFKNQNHDYRLTGFILALFHQKKPNLEVCQQLMSGANFKQLSGIKDVEAMERMSSGL